MYWIIYNIRYYLGELEVNMPTIVIASPKGGAGKSTTAIILGTELAHAGAEVVLLDCDPNGSLSLWASRSALPDRISVLGVCCRTVLNPTLSR